MLDGKRVLIGIGGGIAAYKLCEVISTLFKAEAQVRVILTETATEFITPLTVSTLSRHPAYSDRDFWQPTHSRPLHIELGEWAELFVIAPLTANTLAKLAGGFADNLLTNTVLASRCPILVAPAMNTEMWEQAAVQRNWQHLLQDKRYHTLGPEAGLLACDRVGNGRMAEPATFLPAVQSILLTHGRRDLTGKHILVSAGGTREYLDPVRFIGNPATGKMGVALALAAHFRGAKVTLVCASTVELAAIAASTLKILAIANAAEMREAILDCFPHADWTIMSAAVADFQPANYAPYKLPKSEFPPSIELKPAIDILAELGQQKQPQQRLIGFAAQTGDIVKPALEKLKRKNLDAIAANPIDLPNAGFGSETNQATFLDRCGRQQEMSSRSKLELAHLLLDFVRAIEA